MTNFQKFFASLLATIVVHAKASLSHDNANSANDVNLPLHYDRSRESRLFGFFEDPKPTYKDYSDWMRNLPDSSQLGQLSLPGTHDTMALYGGDMAITQYEKVYDQLKHGIRVLDIRCRHIDNICAMHHGMVYQNALLSDVLNEIVRFFKMYSSETILMRLTEEYKPSNNNRTLNETIKWYTNQPQWANYIWRGGNRIPALGEVRGKIVILDQIGGGQFGLSWERCRECIQDEYEVSSLLSKDIDKKWSAVTNHLLRTSEDDSDNLFINFLSGVALPFAFPNGVANRINPRFVEHMDLYSAYYKKLGVVLMDFPLPKQIAQIIGMNFRY